MATLIVFLLVLSFLVLIHELGHFVAAKVFGIKVEEFGIGYPPRAVKLFKRWGTEFTLNWMPFGGFVRLLGEERELDEEELEEKRKKDEGFFYQKRKWQRIVVILAGAVMNFVFGVVAFSIVYSVIGIPTAQPGVLISDVEAETPAAEAGLETEDVVIAIEEGGENIVDDVDEFVSYLASKKGSDALLTVERGEERLELSVYVRQDDEIPAGQGAIGVAISPISRMVKHEAWKMPFLGAWTGIKAAFGFGMLILTSLGGMLRDLLFSGVVPEEVAGPVGIVYTASREGILQDGFLAIIHFAGILSINLAIVNVLPVPALDGGRVLFILLEKAMGSKFKPVYEHYANMIGFGLLLTLIVLISLRDVGVILSDIGLGLW